MCAFHHGDVVWVHVGGLGARFQQRHHEENLVI